MRGGRVGGKRQKKTLKNTRLSKLKLDSLCHPG